MDAAAGSGEDLTLRGFDLSAASGLRRGWRTVRAASILTSATVPERLNVVLQRLASQPASPPAALPSSFFEVLMRRLGRPIGDQARPLTDREAVGRALLDRLLAGGVVPAQGSIHIETDDEAVAALPWFLLHDGDFLVRRGVGVRVRLSRDWLTAEPALRPLPRVPWVTIVGAFSSASAAGEVRARWERTLGAPPNQNPGSPPLATVDCLNAGEKPIRRPDVLVLSLGETASVETSVRSRLPLGPDPRAPRWIEFQTIKAYLEFLRPRLLVVSHPGGWSDAVSLKAARIARLVPDVLVIPQNAAREDTFPCRRAAEILAQILALRGRMSGGPRGTLHDALESLRDADELHEEGGDQVWSLDSNRPLLEPRVDDVTFTWRNPIRGRLDRQQAIRVFRERVSSSVVLLSGDPGAGYLDFLRDHVRVRRLRVGSSDAVPDRSGLWLVETAWPHHFDPGEITSSMLHSEFRYAVGVSHVASGRDLRARCADAVRGGRLLVALDARGLVVPETEAGNDALASLGDFWSDLSLNATMDATLVVLTDRPEMHRRWMQALVDGAGPDVVEVELERITGDHLREFFTANVVADPLLNQSRVLQDLHAWSHLLLEDGDGRYEALVPALESLPWHYGRMKSRARRRGESE